MRSLTTGLSLVLAAAVLGGVGPSHAARDAALDAAPDVVVLAGPRAGAHAVVSTGAGTVVAVWERATRRRTAIVAAVRPARGVWGTPEVLARWAPGDVDHAAGNPQLALGRAGSVVAVWVSPGHRVVRAVWREGSGRDSGWGSALPLSGPREDAVSARLATDDRGRAAVAWHRRTAGRGVLLRVTVQRGPTWLVRTVGKVGPRQLAPDPAQLGIDDAGNVTVAWYRLRPGQNLSLASRLAAGSTTWEAPHRFVGEYEPFHGDEHIALVVEDDGTAWVGDWAGAWNAPQPGPMWTRAGDGAWVADDRAPYAENFVTNDAGELLTWSDNAHVSEAVSTRQPDGSWSSAPIRASTVVLDDAGRAAAIGIREHSLLVWIRDGSGQWGPERVLLADATRENDRLDGAPVISAAIAPDGTVTVLWRTLAEEPPEDEADLRSVQFSVVAPTP